MLRFRDLSFRYKIPLRAALLIVITAAAVTFSLIGLEYDKLRGDLVASSASLGRVLARMLVTPMSHDDVWRAFEIINSPFVTAPKGTPTQDAKEILVLDAKDQIFASTHPAQYPVLTDPIAARPALHPFRQAIGGLDPKGGEPGIVDVPGSDMLYILTPVVADEAVLGTLIVGYSKSAFLPRFYAIAERAALVTTVVIAVLIPASWFWARRFARPLVELSSNMERIGQRIPADDELAVEISEDELGKAGASFLRMVRELRENEALKHQVIVSERLAAIGRLTAGIAHEINNPLGGMLNAINTFRHHGTLDTFTHRTISMLERGLLQIKETVAALLVEARVESHPLDRRDIEDIRMLIASDAAHKSAEFRWENDLTGSLPLPSTLVRQVLINLLLNAVHAIAAGGRIACHVYRDSTRLHLRTVNDGEQIPQRTLDYLFEPFVSGSEGGHGLGLWMTYQIVAQLGGDITVTSEPGETRFSVTIPIVEHAA